jgi:hypothetical protein
MTKQEYKAMAEAAKAAYTGKVTVCPPQKAPKQPTAKG